MTITVTVVIPLYNKAPYIERTLQSIQAQTYPHWQAIVVDDGSTDDGVERVRRVSDPRIQVIQQPNTGPGAARNCGLRASDTPLIAFLDADDEWLPEFLEQGVMALTQYPDCALWVSGQQRGAAGKPWAGSRYPEGPWRIPMDLPTKQLKPTLDVLHSGAIVARRKTVLELGGFYDRDRCTYGEDIYLWLQVALVHTIYRTPEPLAWYHSESSEIGVWQRQYLPPWPMVMDPQPLRDRCPIESRPLLERYLAYYAILSARRLAAAGQADAARDILRQYPQAWQMGWLYAKALWDVAIAPFPALQQWTQQAQTALRRWRSP
ncbi:glycosyltransferase family 2 protein [Leptolyngbya sp. PCC 6406]|uniref:glycosyltransferase family 2 protein n=1 Tax=Leptolyngbya sp. PCC 6406 TaxID=1173264 RepID=UPI0002ABFF83|nr:glycosyltransferase family A protein [Leptolyngbya sp. PCC 6406]